MNAVYISSNSFSVSKDKTLEFVPGRRVKCDCKIDGIVYANIITSSYSSVTTVTIDESTLTSNLKTVLYGVVEPGPNGSLPIHDHSSTEGMGGDDIAFLSLKDTPSTYSGTDGAMLVSTGSGTVFTHEGVWTNGLGAPDWNSGNLGNYYLDENIDADIVYKKNRVYGSTPAYTAKSVILEFTDAYNTSYMGCRRVEFKLNGVLIAVVNSNYTAYCNASGFLPGKLFDTSLSKTGSEQGGWFVYDATEVWISVVFNAAHIDFDEIVINNYHHNGGLVTYGVKTTKIYISTDSISSHTFGDPIPNSTEIFDGVIAQHVAGDVVDDQVFNFDEDLYLGGEDTGWDQIIKGRWFYGDGAPPSFLGAMDNFYLDKTTNEVYQYTSGTTSSGFSSPDAETVLLLHMEGTDGSYEYVDSGTGPHCPHRISVVGTPTISSAQKKFGNTSAYFSTPASTDKIVTTDTSTDFYFDTDAFSIDFFVKLKSGITSQQYLFCIGEGSISIFLMRVYQGEIQVRMAGTTILGYTWSADDLWHHIAIESDGELHQFLYIDGVCVASINYTGVLGYNGDLAVGNIHYSNYAYSPVDGYIDEFRVLKGARGGNGTTFPVPTSAYNTDYIPGTLGWNKIGVLVYDHSNNNKALLVSTGSSVEFTYEGRWIHDIGEPSEAMGVGKGCYYVDDATSNIYEYTSEAIIEDNYSSIYFVSPSVNNYLTFTNENLTVTNSFGSALWDWTKCNLGKTSGKWYWEIYYDFVASADPIMVGVAESNNESTTYAASEYNGWEYYSYSGALYNSAVNTSWGSAVTTGQTVGIALDLDNGKLFFTNGAGVWQVSQNPETGSNPAFSIPLRGIPIHPTVAINDVHGNMVTGKFKLEEFIYDVPKGYSPFGIGSNWKLVGALNRPQWFFGSGQPLSTNLLSAVFGDIYFDKDNGDTYRNYSYRNSVIFYDSFGDSVLSPTKWDTFIVPNGSITTTSGVLNINNISGNAHSGAHCCTQTTFSKNGIYVLNLRWFAGISDHYDAGCGPYIRFCKQDAARDTTYYGARNEQYIAVLLSQGGAFSTERTSIRVTDAGTNANDSIGTLRDTISIDIDETEWHNLEMTLNCTDQTLKVDLDGGTFFSTVSIAQLSWDSIGTEFVIEIGSTDYERTNSELFDSISLITTNPDRWVFETNLKSTKLINLSDTPSFYNNGKYLRSTVTGTEWADVSTNLIGLNDVPHSYDDGKYLRSTVTGTEWASVSANLIDLTDVPSYYDSGKVLKSTVSGTEWGTPTVTTVTGTVILYGVGDPPSPAGYADGTLYFKYIV